MGETTIFARRLLLGFQINYELGDINENEPRMRDQRYRAGVFARVRNPNLPLASECAKAQSSLAFMPPLGGDA